MCSHSFLWTNTSIGGFAQCNKCYIIDTDIVESECTNYVDPAITKAKRLAQREKQRMATIEWLKNGKRS